MTSPPVVNRRTQRDEVHFVRTADGVNITLTRVSGPQPASRPPVLLVHGVGMRGEFFRPPMGRSLVDALLAAGWDVWLLNWRGSIDFDPLPWTLDDVARYDLPAAVAELTTLTGAPSVKVIAHCAGAAAVSMAAAAGLLPQVDLVVANGVCLHPMLSQFAKLKLHRLRPLLQRSEPYIDAAWGDGPEQFVPLVTRTAIRLWHTECSNPTCNMASFAMGSGPDSVWRHSNLDDGTHEWLRHEVGKIPMSYYHQLAVSDRARQLVSLTPGDDLPARFADAPPATQARFVLLAGDHNRAFLPAGQRASLAFLNRHRPGVDSLRVLPGYSHGDIFIGRRAHAQVFGYLLFELDAAASN